MRHLAIVAVVAVVLRGSVDAASEERPENLHIWRSNTKGSFGDCKTLDKRCGSKVKDAGTEYHLTFWTSYVETEQGKIGTGAMSQQQLNWLESKFRDSQSHRDKTLPYDFERWKGWRERGGFVCDTAGG